MPAVFLLWVLLILSLFWLFQYRYESVWVSFDGEAMPRLVESNGSMQVVHFVDDACPCSKFSKPHISDIEDQWSSQGVRFQTIRASGQGDLKSEFFSLVSASPSVAVWDADGELAYFGPYTSGVFCGEGEDLVSQVLNSSYKGQWTNQEYVGCFCQWPFS